MENKDETAARIEKDAKEYANNFSGDPTFNSGAYTGYIAGRTRAEQELAASLEEKEQDAAHSFDSKEEIKKEIEKTILFLQSKNDYGQMDHKTDPMQTLSYTRGKQAGLNLALGFIDPELTRLRSELHQKNEEIKTTAFETNLYVIMLREENRKLREALKELIPIAEGTSITVDNPDWREIWEHKRKAIENVKLLIAYDQPS